MTCRHCTHSHEAVTGMTGLRVVLWCRLHRTVPQRVCGDYCREPGADDE